MRILIAEDDPVSRRILEAKLVKWGYDVVVTCDGDEAWSALQAKDAPPARYPRLDDARCG